MCTDILTARPTGAAVSFDRGEPAQRVDDGATVPLAEYRRHREGAGELLEFLGAVVRLPVR